MATSIPSWAAHIIGPAIAAGVAYFGAQVTLEHRLTTIEDSVKTVADHVDNLRVALAEHRASDDKKADDGMGYIKDLWRAVNVNHATDQPKP